MRPGDAVVAAQVALGLAPEVLDAVDVASLGHKRLAVVDAVVVELGDIQNVIGAVSVGVDDAVGSHALADDPAQRVRPGVGDHHRMNLARALEQTEDGHLARSTTAAFAVANTTKVALVSLDFAAQIRRFVCQMIRDGLAQLVIEQGRGMPVHPEQLGCSTGGGSSYEMLHQSTLKTMI